MLFLGVDKVLEGKPYNRKCDVYSFGVCLWEIYCCDMPYADCSFAEISHAVVHKVSLSLSLFLSYSEKKVLIRKISSLIFIG